MVNKRIAIRLAAGILALGSVVAGGGVALAQEAQPAGQSVSIIDFAFNPATLTVPVGARVTWTNNGQAPHTASSTADAFDSGRLAPGASFSFTFSTAGSFPYICNIHPQMRGTITVQAAGGGAAQATATRAATTAPPTSGGLPPAPRTATVAAGGQRPAGPVATPAGQRPAAPAVVPGAAAPAPAPAPRPAAPAALPRTGAGAAGDAGTPAAILAGAVLLAGAGAAGIRRVRRG